MLVELLTKEVDDENNKSALIHLNKNISCKLKKEDDGSIQTSFGFSLEDANNLGDLNSLMRGLGKMYSSNSEALDSDEIPMSLEYKTFPEVKAYLKKFFETLKKEKISLDLNSAIKTLAGLKQDFLPDKGSKVFYNDKEFLPFQEDEKEPVLYPRFGVIHGLSLYSTTMEEEMSIPKNHLMKINKKLYPQGFPSELVFGLFSEAKNYNDRAICYWHDDSGEDLETIANNLVFAYRDMERANRIAKLVYENTFFNDCLLDPLVGVNVLRTYIDVMSKTSTISSIIFYNSGKHDSAIRSLDKTLNKINNLSIHSEKIIEKYLEEDNDFFEDRDSSEGWDTQTLKNESQENLIVNPQLGEEMDRFLSFVDVTKVGLCSRKNDILKINSKLRSQHPEFINLHSSIDEIPVMERMSYILETEQYEDTKSLKKLYDKIIMNKDYLGFKVKDSFMF